MLRFSLCFLLLCASATASARDLRMQSANGEEGTCPSAELELQDEAKPVARPATVAAKARKPMSLRTGDNSRNLGPRWHSFLPGMIR